MGLSAPEFSRLVTDVLPALTLPVMFPFSFKKTGNCVILDIVKKVLSFAFYSTQLELRVTSK